jgi:kumamolisin
MSTTPIPKNYVPVEGSERRASPGARLLRPADPKERFSVTIVVRRRPDGESVPNFDYFLKTPPSARPRLSEEEFVSKYGASPEDLKEVTDFAVKNGLEVEETNAARRSVVVSGTVDQMNKAFAVQLGVYQHDVVRRRGDKSLTETYRGREGNVHVPESLAKVIVGVFGLDNRRITKRNASGDPPNTNPLSTEQITQLYNFPFNSASGQTIAILSEGGYLASDINSSFGGSPPTVTEVNVDASNDGSADPETTQDIVIAARAAPGASIAVYFTKYSQVGWVDLISRVAHPNTGDPVCSVLSSSFYVCDGDDMETLFNEGLASSVTSGTSMWVTAVSGAFADAAIKGITICIASGDTGSNSKVGGNPSAWGLPFPADGKAHVQYPGSDPWVLSVGGTTIGNVSGSTFDEYVWNDPDPSDPSQWGTTGGGVSYYFPLPGYQNDAGVPPSINGDGRIGRGVPDVAGNASLNAGYTGITVGGGSFTGNGTSASAPLWAGLIARINAALGVNVGFVNPALYAIGSSGFRDLTGSPGPADNRNAGIPGYPARVGWDACTGWGSPNGKALLIALGAVLHEVKFRPAESWAVSWGAGRLDVFGVGENNDLLHKWFDGSWRATESLGGTLGNQFLSAVSSNAGRLDVFGVGENKDLLHWSFDGSWRGPESLDSGMWTNSRPSAVSSNTGRLDVFGVGENNDLLHKWFDGSWRATESLDSGMWTNSKPSAVSSNAGRLDVFGVGENNDLLHKWFDGSWRGPESLGGTLLTFTSQSAISSNAGLLDVFGVGEKNELLHKWFDGSWRGPESFDSGIWFSQSG